MSADLDRSPRHMPVREAGGQVNAGAEIKVRSRAGLLLPSAQEDPSKPAYAISEEGEAKGDGVERERVEDQDDRATIEEPYDPTAIRISTRRPTVSLVLERLRRGEIDLLPEFQRRGDLWTSRTRSRLIESLLLKIPIPGFYLAANKDDNWVVVDGLQRLGTLREFVLGRALSLRELEYLHQFNGCSYKELPRPMQRRISETELFCHVIEPGTPPEVMYNIFRRINTEGKPLVAQEIRHALNPGPTRKLLAQLADTEAFLDATDKSVSPKRMADRECVLRFLAFRAMGEKKYEGKLDDFLMRAMKKLDKESDRHQDLSGEFHRSMLLASDIFGKEAFRKPNLPGNETRRNPVNKALFESLAVALAEVPETQTEALRSRKERLVAGLAKLMKKDAQFVGSISVGTGSLNNVKYRFGCMRELVQEALS